MSGTPIRVLQLVRTMNRAGVETWLMHLLRHFDRREIAMDFLVQTAVPGAYDEEIRSLGARILVCHDAHSALRYALDTRRALRRNGPYDVVHGHNYLANGVELRLAARGGVPLRIAHIHPVRDIAAHRPLRAVYRLAMTHGIRRFATCVLAPSHASLEAFGDLRGVPHGVIRNVVDLSAYAAPPDRAAVRERLGLPTDRPVAVYVARFVPHKNHALLLRIAGELRDGGLPVHFAVSGTDGETRQAFQQACACRTDFSIFVDMPDIAPLLCAADLFLFPSLEEGFGTVAIEAAAAGLPVVACDLPAIHEACAPSHRKFMFAPDDHSTAVRSVRTILQDPALARKLSMDARSWAKEFSIATVAGQLAEIYRTGVLPPAVAQRMGAQ